MEVSVCKRILEILPAVCLTTSMAWAAESPFIGEWKLDPSKTRMPDEMKVQSQGGNKYAFDFGGGAETIVVDGTDQPGCCGTTLSVKAEAPDTWIVERKKRAAGCCSGRRGSSRRTTVRSRTITASSCRTVRRSAWITSTSARVEDRASRRTGSSIKETMNSPYLCEVKEYEGDGLSFIVPSEHETKNVKFDGKDYPNAGAGRAAGATSSIRRVDERNLVMTNKADGKVIETDEIGLSADLKTLTITKHIPGHDKPIVMVFERK